MKSNKKVFYYCHTSLNEGEKNNIKIKNCSSSYLQVKIIDQDNKDVILDKFGFEEENDLIKFVVHIMLRK